MAGELILVVDDGQENRQFIVDYILTPNGYRALVAKDGREGLELAASARPDLMLLDYQMPRMNGIEVLHQLAALQLQIPVILMTFYGSEEVAVEVYRLGVRDYIRKPFTVDEMFLAIERSLNEVRLRREKEALTERLIQANRELKQRVQELNVLYSVGKSVTALLELHQLLPRVVEAAVKVTRAEEGVLYLVHNEALVCRAQKPFHLQRAESVYTPADDPVAAHVLATGQQVAYGVEQVELSRDGVPTLAYAPLMLRKNVIGVLGVRNVSPNSRSFTTHDSALLSALTDYAAIAIENARNYELLHQTKEHEKARIRSTFQRFVPPQVVDRVLENPELLRLGGKRQEISVLFADLRGYTSFSENLPPEQVVEMLNDYLSLAANVIMSYGGTLDKYMGDGLMAIFNAPDVQANHVDMAAETALTLQQAVGEMAQQRGDGLHFSVGVHVGEAVVGYIGTDCAINYTAVGDVVNLAKRLQEYAKPGQILVEQAVIERLSKQVAAQPLGELKLKGRQKKAVVYELQALALT